MGVKVWVSISAWVIFLISQAQERVATVIDLVRWMHLRGKPNICITFPCVQINPSLICGCECVKIVFRQHQQNADLPIEFSVFWVLLANWQSCGSKVAAAPREATQLPKAGADCDFLCSASDKKIISPRKYIILGFAPPGRVCIRCPKSTKYTTKCTQIVIANKRSRKNA